MSDTGALFNIIGPPSQPLVSSDDLDYMALLIGSFVVRQNLYHYCFDSCCSPPWVSTGLGERWFYKYFLIDK